MLGWGLLACRVLAGKNSTAYDYPYPAIGLAMVLLAGSVLNLCQIASPSAFYCLLAVGVAAWVTGVSRFHRPVKLELGLAALWLVGVLAALPLLVDSLDSRLNSHDDYYAYLVQAVKLSQIGHLQFDPFNYRTVVAGPGGMAFLQSGIIHHVPVNALRLFDQGVGALLLISTTIHLANRHLLPLPMSGIMLVGFFLLAAHDAVNLTAYFLGLVLLLGLFDIMATHKPCSTRRGLLIGLILAGVVALKNTLVPAAGLLLVTMMMTRNRRSQPNALQEVAAAAGTCLLICLMWYTPRVAWTIDLIKLRHGTGVDEVSLSYILWLGSLTFWDSAHWVLMPAAGIVAVSLLWRSSALGWALAVVTSLFVGAVVTTYLTGGVALTRYAQPITLVGYFILSILIASHVATWRGRRRIGSWAVVVALSGGFIVFQRQAPQLAGARAFQRIVSTLTDRSPTVDPFESERHAQATAQSHTPPGSEVLVWSSHPFLFDFRRNTLRVIDFPAASWPAQGPSTRLTAPLLVEYLQSRGIDFLIYSYGDEAGFPDALVKQRLQQPTFSPWQRALNRRVPEFREVVKQVVSHHLVLYKDELRMVVDLREPAK